jgi:hypothetical protein
VEVLFEAAGWGENVSPEAVWQAIGNTVGHEPGSGRRWWYAGRTRVSVSHSRGVSVRYLPDANAETGHGGFWHVSAKPLPPLNS